MESILTTVGTIISALTSWMTSLSKWIIGDDLAMLFFGMMLILFAVKVLLTLVKNA